MNDDGLSITSSALPTYYITDYNSFLNVANTITTNCFSGYCNTTIEKN